MSEAFGIAFTIGLTSAFIKGVILDMPVSRWIMEFIIVMIPALYFTVRMISAGISVYPTKENSNVKNKKSYIGFFSGLVFGAIQFFFINNGETIYTTKNLIISILSAIFFGTLMHFGVKFLNKKSEKVSEEKLIKLENEKYWYYFKKLLIEN